MRNHRFTPAASGVRFLGAVLILGVLGTERVTAADFADAAKKFQAICAMCHGPGGQPELSSPVVQALAVEPANFSDPLFNSREPAHDWFLVVKHGGAALGLSAKMPAFGEALTDDEIRNLVSYVKTLSGQHDYPPGELNLFLPLRTRKAFPEDEVVWKFRHTATDGRDEWRSTLEIEKRFGTRFQGILELSHRYDGSDGEFDRVELGGKYVLHYNLERGRILTLGGNIELSLDGGRTVGFLPYLAVGKTLGEQLTFQGSTRAHLPADGIDGGRMEISGIVHWVHTPWPRSVFPGLELTADVPFERGSGLNRTSFARVSVTPQIRVGLTKGGHVAMNLGVELPLNDARRYERRTHLFLIWDFADGPFWKGW